MFKFVIKHSLKFIFLLLAVSVIAFALVGLSPIDPVQANVGQAAYAAMSEEKRAALAAYWGSDIPLWKRYFTWLFSALQGDLGMSLRFNEPVAVLVARRAGNTLALMALAWVFSGVLGLILGIVAALKRGSLIDKAVKAYCFVLAATPTFWLALLFLMIFSVSLGIFPVGFSMPIGKSAADITIFDSIHHIILPAITLSVVGVANIALHTREKAVDVLESEYMRFAQSRGLSMWHAMKIHGLRNLALPAITLQFASISEIFGGSVLVEQVFSYPGLGQTAVVAGLGGDAALLCAIAIFSAALVFMGNLIANILYGVVDPRIRRGEIVHD